MAQRNSAEIVTGAAVLVLAGGFLAYALAHTGRGGDGGYRLTARFSDITGVEVGSDVRIGGVKVGSITGTSLDPRTYQAVVTLDVRHDIKVPKDSSAVVTTEGLLGGKYLAIQPGGDDQMLTDGGRITVTQSSISLEGLLGKFIFNGAGGGGAKSAAAHPAADAGRSGGP